MLGLVCLKLLQIRIHNRIGYSLNDRKSLKQLHRGRLSDIGFKTAATFNAYESQPLNDLRYSIQADRLTNARLSSSE